MQVKQLSEAFAVLQQSIDELAAEREASQRHFTQQEQVWKEREAEFVAKQEVSSFFFLVLLQPTSCFGCRVLCFGLLCCFVFKRYFFSRLCAFVNSLR